MGRAEQPCDLPQALSPPFTTSLEDSTTLLLPRLMGQQRGGHGFQPAFPPVQEHCAWTHQLKSCPHRCLPTSLSFLPHENALLLIQYSWQYGQGGKYLASTP